MPTAERSCPLCGRVESDLSSAERAERLDLARVDAAATRSLPDVIAHREATKSICENCIHYSLYGEHQMVDALCDDVIRETVPIIIEMVGGSPWGAWHTKFDPTQLNDDEILELLRAGRKLPPWNVIEALYEGWANVLLVAGYGEVPLPSSRGRRSIANDGHACYSDGERLIDDWLDANAVTHTREPRYPGTNFRGDFLVNNVIVEYFGLHGSVDYDQRMELKAEAARVAKVEVVAVFPPDLMPSAWGTTQARLASALGFEVVSRKSAPRRSATQNVSQPVPLGPTTPSWATPSTYSVEPGFYDDPFGASVKRWNDGASWTYRVQGSAGVLSLTPTVDSATRQWVEKTFRPLENAGGVAARGERWLEGVSERIETLPVIASGEPDQVLLARLSALMDSVENGALQVNVSPHLLAAEYFSAFRMRSAELATHRRHVDHLNTPLVDAPYGFAHFASDLVRRGYSADFIAARYAVRGNAPAASADPDASGADNRHVDAVLAFLKSLDIDARIGSAVGEHDAISCSDARVRVHAGPLAIDEAEGLAKRLQSGFESKLLFVDGAVTEEAQDHMSGMYIGLIRFRSSQPAEALNYDAIEFLEDHCEDDTLWKLDPEFRERN